MMNLPEGFRLLAITTTETEADVDGFACGGGLDLGLTESGIKLAQKTARRFKKNPFQLKRIVGSPELRTVQMADIIYDQIKVRLSLHPDLKDQNLGALEGKKTSAPLESPDQPEKGESRAAFIKRLETAFLEIHALKENVLLVTHPRILNELFKSLGLEKESFERGELYEIHRPVGGGRGSFQKI